MKRNSKKSENAAEPPREEIPRDDIRHLGFIVDSDTTRPNALTHALVNLEQAPGIWYVVTFAQRGTVSKAEAALFNYFRTIFFLAVKAMLCYQRDGKLEEKAVIADKTIPRFEGIGAGLRDSHRKDKINGVSTDFPKVRIAIYNSLFAAHGTRRPFNVIWKGKAKPETIFFWTLRSFQNSQFRNLKDEPFQTIEIAELSPKTEFAPDSLVALAKAIIYADYGHTWQDLYLSALCRIPEPEDWIDIKVLECDQEDVESEVASFAKKETTKPEDPLRFLDNKSRVLLIGPSGSGKTTLLKRLAKRFCCEEDIFRDTLAIPVIVPLRSFGGPNSRDVHSAICSAMVETLDNLPLSTLNDWYRRQETPRGGNVSRGAVINEVARDIRRWLENESNLSHLVLLADGLSDVGWAFEYKLRKELGHIVSKTRGCIIATKCAISYVEEFDFTLRLDLQPLNDGQILVFLRKKYPDEADKVLLDLSDGCPKIYDLIHLPFYLCLYRELIGVRSRPSKVRGEGWLIKSFIEKMMSQKLKSGEVSSSVRPDIFSYAMGQLARMVCVQTAAGKPLYLKYPADFVESEPAGNVWEEVLDLGVKLGLLANSSRGFDDMLSETMVAFGHDLFKDFFAAKWLSSLLKDHVLSDDFLNSLLEYKVWDRPFKMYFEIAKGEDQILDDLVLAIGIRDPYLASECIGVKDNWKDKTIWQLLTSLKRWEFDAPQTEGKHFSLKGIRCAEILLSRLTQESLLSLTQKDMDYSLEYVALPKVLLQESNPNTPQIITSLAMMYQRHPDYPYPLHLLEGLRCLNDRRYFELLVGLIDHIIDLRKPALWSDSSYRFMMLILSSDYTPTSEDVESLLPNIKTATVRQILFFKAEQTEKKLEELLKHDDVVKAIAAFKISCKPEHNFSDFLRQMENFDIDHMNNPLMYLLVNTAAHSIPEKMSLVLSKWIDELIEKGGPLPGLFRVMELLISCGHPHYCSQILRVLCEADVGLVRKIVQGEVYNIVSPNVRKELIPRLRDPSSKDVYGRRLFLRVALRDHLTENDNDNLRRIFFESYKEAIDQLPLVHEGFLFNLTCLLKWKTDDMSLLGEIDEEILEQIAPELLQIKRLYYEEDIFSERLISGSEEDCEYALQMITNSSFLMSHLDYDRVFDLLYYRLTASSNEETFMKSLWKQVFHMAAEGQYAAAFQLTYIAGRFESRTGRRWISIRGANPLAEVTKL